MDILISSGYSSAVLCFAAMALTLLPLTLIAASITENVFIPVRRINLLLLVRLSATRISIAFTLLEVSLSATVLVSAGSLVAGVCEMCSITEIHGKIYRPFLRDAFFLDTGCLRPASRITFA